MSHIFNGKNARPLPNRLVNIVLSFERVRVSFLPNTYTYIKQYDRYCKKNTISFWNGIFRFMYSSTGYRFLYIRKAFFVLKY
jgi:hypothetical protein